MNNRNTLANYTMGYGAVSATIGALMTISIYKLSEVMFFANYDGFQFDVNNLSVSMLNLNADIPSYKFAKTPIDIGWKSLSIPVAAVSTFAFVVGGICGYKKGKQVLAAAWARMFQVDENTAGPETCNHKRTARFNH